ncbi:GNAT family N-acetyltransferase [Microlunatus sp. GCM10028923]|uniref:GNAT family N-acetyltransferase n=1 Tax=Microlunatus sp. GCM10028923 TaxID=3273400 RepID=UPI003621ED1D
MPNDHEILPRAAGTDDASAAIEANLDAFLFALGRAGGAEERSDPTVRWTIGGSPIDYHNAVTRARLPADEVDAVIEEMINTCRRHRVPGSWHVGPSMRPTDLGDRLRSHGLSPDGAEPGMALDLSRFDHAPVPAGVEVRRVADRNDLDAWVRTLGAGFGEGPREAAWVGRMYARLGYESPEPWRHYLARSDGRPVGTASLFTAAGVVGVYFVSTHPDVRGRGIGSAVTAAALRDVTGLGYRTAVLNASKAGHPVYRRLGFHDHCTFHSYTFDPRR